MNDNTPGHAAITIAAAGARMRELAPHIRKLETRSQGRGRGAMEAGRSAAVLDCECGALRQYVTSVPAETAEEALAQIDAVALLFEALASEDELPLYGKEVAGQVCRVLASAAGVLAKATDRPLAEFTVSSLDSAYGVAFPVEAWCFSGK